MYMDAYMYVQVCVCEGIGQGTLSILFWRQGLSLARV